MTLIYRALAWLAGLLLGSMVGGPVNGWLIAGLLLAGAAALMEGRRSRVALLAGGCLIALTLALVRYSIALPTIDESALSYYNGDGTANAIVRGTISGPPSVREKDVTVAFSASAVWLPQQRAWQEVSGAAQLLLPLKDRGVAFGDVVELHGRMTVPPIIGGTDSYRQYLARQGILSYISFPSLVTIGHDDSLLSGFYSTIYTLRGAATNAINAAFPQPEGALLVGILLGDRSGMPATLVQQFALTGTAQIVAISGQNISYVAVFIFLIGQRLRLRPRTITILAISTIVVYTIFVGASSSVVRAAIMGSLYAIARQFGRDYDVGISLAVSAWLMTLFNPYWLWDIGFQLSFVALIGLVYLAPTIARALRRLPFLGEALAVAFAAQLVTEPLILMYFGQVSLISPIANVLIEPALPLIMLTGAIATILLLTLRPLGLLAAGACWVFLAFMVYGVEWFASLPFAALQLPPINGWWLLPYYCALIAIFIAIEGRIAVREIAAESPSASLPQPEEPLQPSADGV